MTLIYSDTEVYNKTFTLHKLDHSFLPDKKYYATPLVGSCLQEEMSILGREVHRIEEVNMTMNFLMNEIETNEMISLSASGTDLGFAKIQLVETPIPRADN